MKGHLCNFIGMTASVTLPSSHGKLEAMLLYQRTPFNAFDYHRNSFSFTPTQQKAQINISCRQLQRKVYFDTVAIAQADSNCITNFNPFTADITSSLSHELQQSLSRAFWSTDHQALCRHCDIQYLEACPRLEPLPGYDQPRSLSEEGG